jgi:tetratricopeptide (TPR) repeat protein
VIAPRVVGPAGRPCVFSKNLFTAIQPHSFPSPQRKLKSNVDLFRQPEREPEPLSQSPATPAHVTKPFFRRTADVLYLSLALITLAYALLAGLKTVVDFDLGWQMATGRYILVHYVIPRTELFSYTAHGVEWIYPILSGIVFYLLYQIGGYAAISWLCALTCVACIALLIYKRSFWAVALALLSVPVFASEIMPRASLFTMLFFTAFARILLEHFEAPEDSSARRAPLWLLPVLMLLWVNLHTGFIAGLALIAAYLLIEALEAPFPSRRTAVIARLKQAAPWLIATAFATLLNPWGARIFVALSRQQSALRWQSISLEEWQPVQLANALQELNWRTPDSARWWLLALGIFFAAVCLWRRRIGPALILLAAAYAFLRHGRMEAPCIIVICLIGGSVLTNAATRNIFPRSKINFKLATAALLALLAAVRSFDLVTNRTYLSSADITLFGAGRSWWLPEQATNFLLQNHLSANVFSSFNLSSYLVWRLGDRYPDFADGRYLPFGEQLFEQQRQLASLPLDSAEWTQAADKYHIATIIFPLSRVFALGEFPLLADCESTHWTPVYMDTFAIIFQRKPSTQPPIDCRTQNLLSSSQSPATDSRQRAEQYQVFANASAIYSLLGRLPEARDAADRAESISSQDPTLHFIKAQTATGARQYDQAEDELQAALKIRQTDAGWYNLGLLYISERRFPDAVEALKKSASLSRQDDQRYLLIARLYLVDQQPQAALDAFAQAARRSPYTAGDSSAAEFRAQIAEGQAVAFMQLGQPQQAVERQRFALQQTPQNDHRRQVLLADCKAVNLPCPFAVK